MQYVDGKTMTENFFAEEKQNHCHAAVRVLDLKGRLLYYVYVKEYRLNTEEWTQRHVWVTGARERVT
jgi:hypothetical protein